jgi:hypothetical protein
MGRMGLYSKATKAGPPGSPVSCIVSRDLGGLKVRWPGRKSGQEDNC